MKKIFLFDLDGTVTEPKEGITKCVQYSLTYFGIYEENLDKLECFIGPPLYKSYQDYYGLSEEDSIKAVEKYRERYADVGIYECNLYDGIEKVFQTIKENGGLIGLATSKPEVFAIQLLEYYKIDKYFDCITGSLMNGRTEKDEVIQEVFSRMNINQTNSNQVIMIGDRKYDIIGAKKMGIDSIGVKYGYAIGNELEEAEATHIVDTTEELNALVDKLMK